MDDENESVHTYELTADRWISVEVSRRWPKYVAAWSIRQRSGDSDFPVASGEVERMPPREPAELEGMLEELRLDARRQAQETESRTAARKPENRGLFSRLFGR